MRLPRPTALLAAAAVLLAGCSGGSTQVRDAPTPSPTGPAPAALVRAAAATTDQQGSSRYSLTTSTKVGGADVVFSGVGVFDWKAGRGQTSYDVPVGTVQQRVLGGDLYLSLPQKPGVFFKLKSGEVAATPLGGMVHPTAQLHTLAAVGEAERVGEEEVRGEATTHYRGSYDVARAIRGARGLQSSALKSSLGAAAALPQAAYDVFLDAQGRLRRLQQTVEVPASPAPGSPPPLTVTTTLELYDFGIEVKVIPPPGATVRDGAPLLDALRKALPQPSPAPSLTAPPRTPLPVPPAPTPR